MHAISFLDLILQSGLFLTEAGLEKRSEFLAQMIFVFSNWNGSPGFFP